MLGVADEIIDVYPWHVEAWRRLLRQHADGQLPHALMFNGPPGCGKRHLAMQLVNYLLCSSPTESQACGQCKGCQLLQAGSHPDAVVLEPEESGKAIKIDQVRRAAEFVTQTAQMGGYKGIVICPAEALNISAANALLKILEEPGVNTLFILVSSEPGRVTATVRSRCNKITLALPEREQAKTWLAQHLDDMEVGDATLEALLNFAGNSPLLALQAHENEALQQRKEVLGALIAVAEGRTSSLEIASRLEKIETLVLVGWLQAITSDLVKTQLLGERAPVTLENEREFLLKLAQHISLHALYFYIDGLIQARQSLLSGHNPNKLLLVEDLLISWSKACKTGSVPPANTRKR